jgi:hypothetical protein
VNDSGWDLTALLRPDDLWQEAGLELTPLLAQSTEWRRRGFSLQSGVNLQSVPYQEYRFRGADRRVRAVAVVPSADVPWEDGQRGVEIVLPADEIVAHVTRPIAELATGSPAEFAFVPALFKSENGWRLRVFSRNARTAIRVLELRKQGLGIGPVAAPSARSSRPEEGVKYFNSSFAPPLKIDLGCGAFKRSGYIGIDNYHSEYQWKDHEAKIDVNWDLAQGVPFENGTVSAIYSSHFLEHTNIDFMLREIHRVAAPGAEVHIVVPYANSAEGMYPGHVNFLTEKFFNNNTCFQEHFKDIEYRFDPTPEWNAGLLQTHLDIPFDVARIFLFNVCWQMHVLCRPRK